MSDPKLSLTEMLQLLAAGVMTKAEVREAMNLSPLVQVRWDESSQVSIR